VSPSCLACLAMMVSLVSLVIAILFTSLGGVSGNPVAGWLPVTEKTVAQG
jgi:uncharacterized membrane protein